MSKTLTYQVEIPDHDYFMRQVNCRDACPVGTNAGGYVALIAAGRFADAYAEARRPNPLASICGRICAHPCEAACRRGAIDKPLSIRALKRFVTERYGVEAPNPSDIRSVVDHPGKTTGASGKKVAVIGAGPASLACAHDLALLGHDVTIFEKSPVVGGMLYLGIPEYRLPRELLKQEVRFIEDLGVEIRLNTGVGEQVSFSELRRDHDAVFVGAGCMKGRGLGIEGHELDGVLKAVDFLLNVNLGYKVDLGQHIVVIGGGSVAFDAARSASRVGGTSEPEEEDHHVALDTARALRRAGVRQVTVFALESAEEMPADPIEVVEALEEGITIVHRRGPKRILGTDGQVCGLQTIDVASVFDEHGRFSPVFVEGSEKTVDCDGVILAVGQEADLSFLGEDHGVKLSPRKLIEIERESCATSAEGVFAGGDIAFGPRIAIEAVADGKRAALAIHKHLGCELEPGAADITVKPLGAARFRPGSPREDYDTLPRSEPPALPIERRVGPTEVECPYPQDEACLEGARCLHCWVAPIFDSQRCILCGGCVDVCPELCLKLVDTAQLQQDALLTRLLGARYGGQTPQGSAIIKDDTACIRCGLCARRCPVDAIEMKSFSCKGDRIDD